MTSRSLLPFTLAPAAIGLAGLVFVMALDPPIELAMTAMAAVVALQAGISLLVAGEVSRRLNQTRQAREAMLASARRAAEEEAERARARLVAATAHELRTPIGGIVGLLEAVLSAPGLPRGARDDAAAALEAARDLSLGLREMGDMPDGAATEQPSQPFRVDEAMEGVVALLAMRAAASGVRLATAVAPGTPPAWRGDPARIRRILVALVAQALRSTTRGEVRLQARETAAGALELAVSDTGRGIPADRLPHIFEPFSWPEGGVGLRLSTARELVQRLGGSIAVQSAPDRGSVFIVTLPLPKADPAEAITPTAAPQPPGMTAMPDPAPSAPAGTPPVLVVDDVAVNRRLLCAMLQRAGHACVEAADGAAALALLAERPFLAVLMDVEMPGIDGLETTRRLRAMPGTNAGLPVIAVTAHRTAEGEAAARAAGMQHYLVKPVSAADLVALLGRLSAPAPAGT